MKITSPTMLGASHHVVSGWAASAEPVLFLSSSVGLQSWSGGAHSGVSICPQPHAPPRAAGSEPEDVLCLLGTLARADQVMKTV